jgi:hypothetical protein
VKAQAPLIERLTEDEKQSDGSFQALLRLLIDEIVDDLSKSGSGCESRPVQKLSPTTDAVLALG